MINSWGINKFIRVVLAIQLAVLGLVGLATLGFDIPVLRQIIGFIFLTFVPGLLLLRILRLHRLGAIETLLYSVGLSIAFVMFTGFFINMFYPLIGISKPISIFPVMATITFIVLILCIIAYKRESSREESLPQNSPIRWSELFSPPALLLLLLPILTILGTQLVYLHQDNTVLFILLSLIVLVVTLVAFGKFIPTKLYPLAIVVISISLLWHWSLIGPGLGPFDINLEYHLQKLVLSNATWDYTLPGTVQAMLSIVMLAPIYSLILNLDTVWIFKIFYPLFFSVVPLALFQAYRKQTSDKIAFLAVFFFMSWATFWTDGGNQPRQAIAEIFLALTILLFLSKEMAATKRGTLLTIFAFCIVVSHYGVSYIYMLYLLMALPLLLLWRSSGGKINNPPWSTLTATYVMLFIVFCLTWYTYFAAGAIFSAIVRIGDQIYSTLITDFFLLETRDQHIVQALGLMPMRGGEVEWEIARIFQYITQLFIVVGILGLIASRRKTRFHPEFAVLSLISMVILAMCIILPHFAAQINMSRIYHITLFFLAPFCILGGIATFRWLFGILRLHRLQGNHALLKLVVILVLVPYFLFTTGLIFELTGATQTSQALSLHRADWPVLSGAEIRASEWLANMAGDDFVAYADPYGVGVVYQRLGHRAHGLPSAAEHIHHPSYIFLRHWNIAHNEVKAVRMVGVQEVLEYIDVKAGTDLGNAFWDRGKIYDNGWAQVLGPR